MAEKTVQIQQIKNQKGDNIAPMTVEKAVFDENGQRLSDKLAGIDLKNIKDTQDAAVDLINKTKEEAVEEVQAQFPELKQNIGLDKYKNFIGGEKYKEGDIFRYEFDGKLYICLKPISDDWDYSWISKGYVKEYSLKEDLENQISEAQEDLETELNKEVTERKSMIDTLDEVSGFCFGLVDKNGSLLLGVKEDGSCYQPKGMPEETKKAFEVVKQAIDTINTKVNITEVRIEEFDHNKYIYAIVDSNRNVLWAIDKNGNCVQQKGIPEESQENFKKIYKNLEKLNSQLVELEHGTYLYSVVDANGVLLWGIDKEGNCYQPKGMPEETKKALAIINEKVNIKDVKIVEYLDDNYVYSIIDQNQNVLWAIKKDGTCYQQKGIPDEVALQLNRLNSYIQESNNSDYVLSFVDSEQNFLFGVDKKGHFKIGSNFAQLLNTQFEEIETNENQDTLYHIVDKEGKVLFNITKDGKLVGQKGIILDGFKSGITYEENKDWLFAITDINNNLLAGIDKNTGFYCKGIQGIFKAEEINNQDYIYALCDENNSLLLGIKKDGTICPTKFKINELQTIEEKEFLYVITDNQGYIVFGIRSNGKVYAPKGITEEAKNKIDILTQQILSLQDKIDNKEEKEINNIAIKKVMYDGNQGRAFIGNATLQEPGLTDYCIIMMYGQSLSNGSENPAGFNDPVVENCYMLGNNVWSTSGDTLNSLKVGGTVREDGVATGTRQDTIVSTVNSFVTLYHKERPWDKNTKFIACSMGVGGRTVAQLSGNKYADGNTTTLRYPNCNEKWLETNVKTYFQSVKAIADKEGKTISLSAVFWKQGESDYGTGYIGKSYDEWKAIQDAKETADSNAMQGSFDAYYKGLTILKEDIFALAKNIFGEDQKNSPVFMPYSVCGTYINNAYMTINSATMRMAEEQDNVIQVAPTYVTPDYNGGHLSMNGYRWYGEYCGKALYYLFLQHLHWTPMQPYNYEVKDNQVFIYINPIVPPLRFDQYTVGNTYKDYGFIVRQGSVAELDANKSASQLNVKITNISIVGGNCIVLTCGEIESFTKSVEVIYAGQGASGYSGHNQGAGNLRDSDTWQSLYSYRDDSADHGSRNSNWTGSTLATEEEKQTLQYWDENYASATGYSKDDKVLFDFIEYNGPVVLTSAIDNNKNLPANPVNYHACDVKGNMIIGKKYPMQNWCLNFYKRIILGE